MTDIMNSAKSKVWQVFFVLLLMYPCFICQADSENLLVNPGFEQGRSGWTNWGCSLMFVTDPVHSGNYSVLSANRSESWQGPVQSVLGKMPQGKTYKMSAWVMLQNAPSAGIGITVRQKDSGGSSYPHICWATAYDDQWSQLVGYFTLDVIGTLTDLDFYIEGPDPSVNFYVDDTEIVELVDWRQEANERIEEVRKRDVELTVLSPMSQPVSNVDVQIRQIKHDFAFGSCINYRVLYNQDYADFFKDHFEWAVMENESKWYSNEPRQGYVNYYNADGIYDFCSENGITMRGHCLYWAVEGNVQNWIKNLPFAQLPNPSRLWDAVYSRMESAMSHFKGKFVHWDINNEMVPGSFFKDRLGEDVRIWMFQEANRIDPNCVLFVNEYNVISGGWSLQAYKNQIIDLLDCNAPVHAVGVQCHMNAGFDRAGVLGRFDSIAEVGLPVWVTEFDVSEPNEFLRADDLEDFYRIAFSHPAVEGILMWGFWEDSQWRDNCYIVNSDWSLNEAGKRYEQLIDEWTTDVNDVTDPNGRIAFRGFHGSYEIILTPLHAPATVRTVYIEPDPNSANITLQLDFVAEQLDCREVNMYGLRLPGDLDGDCKVDTFDLDIFSSYWLVEDSNELDQFLGLAIDTTGDVDFSDFSALAENWMQSNEPENSSGISSR